MEELAAAASHAQLFVATHEKDRFEPLLGRHFAADAYGVVWVEDFDPVKPHRQDEWGGSTGPRCGPVCSRRRSQTAITRHIAAAPFHMIESLTEPPEGDMTYAQCRAAWPDKVFWGNINLENYYLPPDQLRQEVIAKRERAGKRAFAFELSEDLPLNWRDSIPIVLKTLEELG